MWGSATEIAKKGIEKIGVEFEHHGGMVLGCEGIF